MRWVGLGLAVFLFATQAAHADDDMQKCVKRRAEMLQKLHSFKGDPQNKKDAEDDIRRAWKEQAEGDGDECLDALNHAEKILAGKS